MIHLRIPRYCIICLLTSLLAGIVQTASAFSFGFGMNSNRGDEQNGRTTTNRPWGNIGAFKPGVQSESNLTTDNNGYSYSYSYSYGSPNMNNTAADNGNYLGGAPVAGWPGNG